VTQRNFKTDALVLLSRPLGEADRLITFLSWERGKFTAVAKGARKTKSKLAAGVDLFTYGQYQFYQGRNLATLTGQEVKEHFKCFRENPEIYPYGLYLAELAGRLISGEEPSEEACSLLLDGWRLLGDHASPVLLSRAFELKFMDITGHCPFFNGCLHCGADCAEIFSPQQGGLVCRACGNAPDGLRVQPGTAALARRLLQAPLAQVKLLRPQVEQLNELTRVNAAFLRYHLDIGESGSLRLLKLFD
jgi:DNA repair protein RecO (recombination protein O)